MVPELLLGCGTGCFRYCPPSVTLMYSIRSPTWHSCSRSAPSVTYPKTEYLPSKRFAPVGVSSDSCSNTYTPCHAFHNGTVTDTYNLIMNPVAIRVVQALLQCAARSPKHQQIWLCLLLLMPFRMPGSASSELWTNKQAVSWDIQVCMGVQVYHVS